MVLNSLPITPDKQAALEKYLSDPAFEILLEVLEAGRFELQVQAARDREAEADTLAAVNAVNLDEQARQIQRTIGLLITMRRQKEAFTTATASPS